ncbi:peroxisomal carnitine O-octanoyltransferase-like [Mizuhopecten yessoensis]|nr:peroxisomal carnitine O-octanoyltransferase-like [Mizuhopecten yessoensis]XP_021370207.1 peroxisomal carnitine O-octanoyltransferase-like [Mizuhopecten yessoensis]XP_021370208.1 peroxisomal carnitine O-octanoyltransferase-like [Mizuhopecten yessoensis]XP_021370210.1 peroxisomal carnitine O-octanoyltransferase-like [Mizuhopecten yessoensis]
MNFGSDNIPDPNLFFTTDEEKTFQYEESLPSLPMPDLHKTLDRYLDSIRPHVTADEYRQTAFLVQQFGSGIGKELDKKLKERAQNMRNWLEAWWENSAYLEGRYPAAPFVNFGGPGPYMSHYLPAKEGTQVERASLVTHFALQYWKMIRQERLKPDKDRQGAHLSMSQFHRAFNTCKIPGIKKDKLLYYFKTVSEGDTPIHVVVFCRGRIFTFDCIDEDGEPLTAPELKIQFQKIRDLCDGQPEGPGIGQLTADERPTWAQMRSRLLALHPDNHKHLELIQSSLMAIALDDNSPTDESNVFEMSLAGDPRDRWFDKSSVFIFYKNGLAGSNCDHAPMDAMIVVSSTFYIDLNILRCKGKWQGSMQVRDFAKPAELVFHIDDVIREGITKARQTFLAYGSNLSCCAKHFQGYGKKYLRSKKLHPDTHVQLAMQYAYYKMHKKPAPTYETATTRRFYRARTETLRSCTVELVDWCKVMLDPMASKEKKLRLYLRAADKHNQLMLEATKLQGCDRHLLGLMLIAKEEGLPTPLLYEDISYKKSGGGGNFVLSTSFVGYTTCYGAVAPMVQDGYGTFYRVEQEKIVPVITSWSVSQETNAEKFADAMMDTLSELGKLLEYMTSTSAKL